MLPDLTLGQMLLVWLRVTLMLAMGLLAAAFVGSIAWFLLDLVL